MKPKANLFLPSALLAAIASLGAANHAQAQTIYQWNGTPTASSVWTTGRELDFIHCRRDRAALPIHASMFTTEGARRSFTLRAREPPSMPTLPAAAWSSATATGAVAGSMEITGGRFSTLGSMMQRCHWQ